MTTATPKKTGSVGSGRYFHVEVSPKEEFSGFYTKDVGRRGHSLLVLGRKKSDGKWATHKWLVNKDDAYISDRGKLKSDDTRVQQILDYVDGNLTHKEKDTFYVRPHRSLKKMEEEHKRCSPEVCPDMYFENYGDYEKYEDERLDKPIYLE